MKERFLITDIDSICNLFKDYCGAEDIPPDAMPVAFRINPANKMLGIVMDSPSWKEGLPPLRVSFQIKRVFGV